MKPLIIMFRNSRSFFTPWIFYLFALDNRRMLNPFGGQRMNHIGWMPTDVEMLSWSRASGSGTSWVKLWLKLFSQFLAEKNNIFWHCAKLWQVFGSSASLLMICWRIRSIKKRVWSLLKTWWEGRLVALRNRWLAAIREPGWSNRECGGCKSK